MTFATVATVVGVGAGLTSIAGGIDGMVSGGGGGRGGGGGSSVPGASQYVPQQQGWADSQFIDQLKNLQGQAGGNANYVNPLYQSYTQNQLTNPFEGSYLSGMQGVGNQANQNAWFDLAAGRGLVDTAASNTRQRGGVYDNLNAYTQGTSHALLDQLPALYQSGNNVFSQAQDRASSLTSNANQNYGSTMRLAPQLQGIAGGQMGAANSILQSAYDPQNALFGRSLQQLQDLTNVNNSRSGTAGSPFGAGVANQADSNFLIDWQNNQLGRQLQGANAYGSLTNSAAGNIGAAGNLQLGALAGLGGAYTGAQNISASGAGTMGNLYGTAQNALTGAAGIQSQGAAGLNSLLNSQMQNVGQAYSGAADLNQSALQALQYGANAPYGAYNTVNQNKTGALDAFLNGTGNAQNQQYNVLQALQSYLGLGQSGGRNALAAQNQGYLQNQQNLGNITSGLSGLGGLSKLFGGGGGGGGGGVSYPDYNGPTDSSGQYVIP